MKNILLAPITWLKKILFIRNLNINFSGSKITKFEISTNSKNNLLLITFYFNNHKNLLLRIIKKDDCNILMSITATIQSVLNAWPHAKINGFHYVNFLMNDTLSFLENRKEKIILSLPLAIIPEIINC